MRTSRMFTALSFGEHASGRANPCSGQSHGTERFLAGGRRHLLGPVHRPKLLEEALGVAEVIGVQEVQQAEELLLPARGPPGPASGAVEPLEPVRVHPGQDTGKAERSRHSPAASPPALRRPSIRIQPASWLARPPRTDRAKRAACAIEMERWKGGEGRPDRVVLQRRPRHQHAVRRLRPPVAAGPAAPGGRGRRRRARAAERPEGLEGLEGLALPVLEPVRLRRRRRRPMMASAPRCSSAQPLPYRIRGRGAKYAAPNRWCGHSAASRDAKNGGGTRSPMRAPTPLALSARSAAVLRASLNSAPLPHLS